jgi:hypothetical protein
MRKDGILKTIEFVCSDQLSPLPKRVAPPDRSIVSQLMTVGGTILFLRAKIGPKVGIFGARTGISIEGELNLQPMACAEKRLAIREEWLSELHGKRECRAAEKEMNIETSHGYAIVPENFGNVAWYQRGSPVCADARAPGGG